MAYFKADNKTIIINKIIIAHILSPRVSRSHPYIIGTTENVVIKFPKQAGYVQM